MKHLIKTVICVFVISAFITIKSFSQTVYVTETGKKYHTKNCTVAGTGKKGMPIADAKKAGYTPCKVCKPDEVQKAVGSDKPKATDKPKAAEPKKPATTTPPVKPK
jgi:hypothetical protein